MEQQVKLTPDMENAELGYMRHDSGAHYIVQFASMWNDDDECVGDQIVTSYGPLKPEEIAHLLETICAKPEGAFYGVLNDEYLNKHELNPVSAPWLQNEEDAGRLSTLWRYAS